MSQPSRLRPRDPETGRFVPRLWVRGKPIVHIDPLTADTADDRIVWRDGVAPSWLGDAVLVLAGLVLFGGWIWVLLVVTGWRGWG